MNRSAVIATSLGLALLAGCGYIADSGTNQPAPTAPTTQATCGIFNGGYALTFTNRTAQPVQVTGFSVTFASNGQETSSDNEPGNGTITDPDTNGPTQTIGMNDWIAPGSTFTYQVQPSNGMPQADTCELANWTDQ